MRKLLFIYNASSGSVNAVRDIIQKVMRPGEYPCNLCKITYGFLTENNTWKNFRRSGDIEMEFLCSDEYQKQYASKFGYKFSYPIVLLLDNNGMEVFISTQELNEMKNSEDLIDRINKRKNM